MPATAAPTVEGHVSRGFEAVREAFAENFAHRHELGGACCVYRHGQKVVDLWGGIRNKETGEPWERDTMVIVYSATKGLAAMTLALAHSRGWLDYEERVCPVLAGVRAARQGGDHRPPAPRAPGGAVRARRAGRSQPSSPTSIGWRSCWRARSPRGSPARGRRITPSRSGSTKARLLRRVDPQHRSLGQFFQDEIASPLGLDVYIRLPESIPNSRLATIARPGLDRDAAGLRSALHAARR